MSADVTAAGSRVNFSRKQSMARTGGSTGDDRQSSSTEATSASSPDAFDTTAPCALVQKTHWLSRDVNAANSSRSHTAQSEGPRMTF